MIFRCNKCKSIKIKKNWKRGLNQKFLCKECWYIWVLWNNKKYKYIESNKLFSDYVKDDLKYRQIIPTLNVSLRTVQNRLDKAVFKKTIMMK